MKHDKYLAELQLILSACQAKWEAPEQQNLLLALASPLEWDFLYASLHGNGIEALFYSRLKDTPGESLLPSPYKEQLRQAYYLNLQRNVLMEAEAGRVLKLLGEEGILAVIIKGLSLAKYAYGRIDSRQMSDMDLLVGQESLFKAYELLKGADYQPFRVAHSKWHMKNMHRYSKHLPPLWNGRNSLDLHGKLFEFEVPGATINQAVMAHLQPASYSGTPAYRLHNAHQLVYTAAHLDGHLHKGGFQLRLYCDLAMLMTRQMGNEDWAFFGSELGRFDVAHRVLPHILLAKKHLGASFPLRPDTGQYGHFTEIEDELFYQQVSQGKKPPPEVVNRDGFLEAVKRIPGWKERVICSFGYVFPSKAFVIQRYQPKHRELYFLYYLPRLWRILRLAFMAW